MAHLRAVSFKKTVASAGTPERLVDTQMKAVMVIIQAWDDNTDGFFIEGFQAADGAAIELDARESLTITSPDFGSGPIPILLNTIYVDADTTDDGIAIFAMVIDE